MKLFLLIVLHAVRDSVGDVSLARVGVPSEDSHMMRRLSEVPVSPGENTLQAALDGASAGDVLVLADGLYTSSNNEVLKIGQSITVRATNAGRAILDGEGSKLVSMISGGTVVLDGLTITGGLGHVSAHKSKHMCPSPPWIHLVASLFCLQGGGLFIKGGNVTLDSCDIHDNRAYGVSAHKSKHVHMHMCMYMYQSPV